MSDPYDFIIVGAGSAGCVLAYRLSENPRHRVLLIEAGPPDTHPLIPIPMGVGKTLAEPSINWYYMTEPDAGNAHRARVWLRGKTLGGSSAVNGMMYMRGQPYDYDHWEALGNQGWGWQDMLRSFIAMEDHVLGADSWRGAGGPLGVSIQSHRSPFTEALLQAGAAMGVPVKPDLNRPELEGIGYTPVTIRDGRRVSAADAFLKPAMRRANLRVLTGMQVDRVLFEGTRAVGVVVRGAGQDGNQEMRASQIILCTGALHTPKLLQLSGVGPAAHLQVLGIPIVQDSPGVGANMREHKSMTIQQSLTGPYSHNRELRGVRLLKNFLRYKLFHTGVLASTYDVTAFIRTRPDLLYPDAQLTFWSLSFDKSKAMELERHPGMMVMGYPLRTESEGSVMIRSANPDDPPVIRTNFLTAEYDRTVTIAMFRWMRRFFEQPVLRPYLEGETFPGMATQSDEEILEACRQDETCLHANGTCRMGRDAMAVVDDHLRVRGVTGLRVMDCSVMPTQVSGNTNGPVMAMAWRAAEKILEDGLV